jgi:NAD(P)-dependent dehydrogenase (short-subunit alcohol dehydrogenase family)
MKKSAVITGASSGIGLECAKFFSKKGYFVFLCGRNTERLQLASQQLENSSNYQVVVSDLLKQDSILRSTRVILNTITEKRLELSSLINCAGIYTRKSFESSHFDDWTLLMNTNVLGPAEWTRQFIPQLIQSKGSIVNVSSTLGQKPSSKLSIYCATKAALNSWTQSLAIEMGPHQVRVNAICPGLVDTPIHDFHFLKTEEKEKVLMNLGKLQPLGRIGNVEEIAKSIYFLASEESAWTTGALLNVDGGINLV